ncbi:collagen alpha-1(III) chain-like [Sphaerodactylus townsendi]|uniref:collagen alpha-1(III) chain-like n=1 Tax=Sphaerodactylus townsendi TaxID=933632 RepID=UPI0020271007|nr:collagen alpha-1(III) chain-like [Sphaerodactylus townsendi]
MWLPSRPGKTNSKSLKRAGGRAPDGDKNPSPQKRYFVYTALSRINGQADPDPFQGTPSTSWFLFRFCNLSSLSCRQYSQGGHPAAVAPQGWQSDTESLEPREPLLLLVHRESSPDPRSLPTFGGSSNSPSLSPKPPVHPAEQLPVLPSVHRCVGSALCQGAPRGHGGNGLPTSSSRPGQGPRERLNLLALTCLHLEIEHRCCQGASPVLGQAGGSKTSPSPLSSFQGVWRGGRGRARRRGAAASQPGLARAPGSAAKGGQQGRGAPSRRDSAGDGASGLPGAQLLLVLVASRQLAEQARPGSGDQALRAAAAGTERLAQSTKAASVLLGRGEPRRRTEGGGGAGGRCCFRARNRRRRQQLPHPPRPPSQHQQPRSGGRRATPPAAGLSPSPELRTGLGAAAGRGQRSPPPPRAPRAHSRKFPSLHRDESREPRSAGIPAVLPVPFQPHNSPASRAWPRTAPGGHGKAALAGPSHTRGLQAPGPPPPLAAPLGQPPPPGPGRPPPLGRPRLEQPGAWRALAGLARRGVPRGGLPFLLAPQQPGSRLLRPGPALRRGVAQPPRPPPRRFCTSRRICRSVWRGGARAANCARRSARPPDCLPPSRPGTGAPPGGVTPSPPPPARLTPARPPARAGARHPPQPRPRAWRRASRARGLRRGVRRPSPRGEARRAAGGPRGLLPAPPPAAAAPTVTGGSVNGPGVEGPGAPARRRRRTRRRMPAGPALRGAAGGGGGGGLNPSAAAPAGAASTRATGPGGRASQGRPGRPPPPRAGGGGAVLP